MSDPLKDVSDAAFASLVRLCDAALLTYHPDQEFLAAALPDGRVFRIEFEVLDLLVEKGWLVLTESEATVSDSGRYWADRWKRHKRVRRT